MNDRTQSMYDLHGLSEAAAKDLVVQAIREAAAQNIGYIRFVTGRGNHINAKGERGTLYRAFPQWLAELDYQDRVEVNPADGHYTVHIKPSKVRNHKFDEFMKKATSEYMAENLDAIIIAADAGDPEAQLLYAGCLERGEQVTKNEKLSATYVKKAAKSQCLNAMHEYARYWLHGVGVRQSDEKAIKWLWRAHEAGSLPSTVTLAKGYANALTGYPYDLSKAIELHTIAAAGGMTDSMRFFGSIYLSGQGVERCEKTSFKWYLDAAKLNDAKAQFNVATMYMKGNGVKKNEEKAFEYFEKSALNGDSDAQFIYGQHLLRKGDAFKKQAMTIIFIAAENGSESANEFMARCLKDESAKIYLERSAQAGNVLSQQRLNKINGVHHGPEAMDVGVILKRFRVLGDNEIKLMSSRPQCILLDTVLLQGKKRDRIKAIRLIEEMAEQRCANSMRRLVYFYQRGDGLFKMKKSSAKVLELLAQAVELSDPVSMVMLAQYYEKDHSGRSEEVSDLYLHASKLGYPPAYYHRGLLLEKKSQYKPASICFTTAIELESSQEIVDKFIFGPLDQYQPITALAKAAERRVRQHLKTSTEKVTSNQPTYMGMKSGFFQQAEKKIVEPVVESVDNFEPEHSPEPELAPEENNTAYSPSFFSVTNVFEAIGRAVSYAFN